MNPKTIIELGAGYGRTAYVFLKANPDIRYTICDIEPALSIAKRYLISQFPDADITFLSPNNLRHLPKKSADLFITISSLQEMPMEQIKYYYKQIDRLAKYFYTKQWKVSKIPYENVIIKQADYPTPPHWKRIYERECAVQVRFFEALYKISN